MANDILGSANLRSGQPVGLRHSSGGLSAQQRAIPPDQIGIRIVTLKGSQLGTPPGCESVNEAIRGSPLRFDPRLLSPNPSGCKHSNPACRVRCVVTQARPSLTVELLTRPDAAHTTPPLFQSRGGKRRKSSLCA